MDFYNHGSSAFDDTTWAIWQYHDPETQSGIVMAFRRCNSPFDNVKIELKGILKGQNYIFTNIDDGTYFIASGNPQIVLPQKRSSVILEYKLK